MHIILAILGSIITILILINRLSDAGLDIGWLNPFLWHRRRSWRKKFEGNPIFSLADPLEVAALLATTVAKIDGEISQEEKETLLSLFKTEFNKSEQEASDLLMFSIHLFGNGEEAIAKPEKIIKTSLEKFTKEQAASVIHLLEAVLNTSSLNTELKENYIKRVNNVFEAHFKTNQKW